MSTAAQSPTAQSPTAQSPTAQSPTATSDVTDTDRADTGRAGIDRAEIRRAIHEDGIVGRQGAFTREWVDRLAEDVDVAFEEALGRPGGAVGRGPERYYVEIHPQALRGFVDIATHPWITAATEAILGPDWTITEVGFDVPGQGAMNQPWHRDFPMPAEARDERRLTSLHFNITAVDTEPDMGPFEVAPGTQWDDGEQFEHGMFPPPALYPRYEERAVRRFPQRGDISARTALTLHRGTRHASSRRRPVLVIGMDGPDGTNFERHDMAVTRDYWASLPESVRRHLACPVVDALEPISQKHTIEGLVMGEA